MLAKSHYPILGTPRDYSLAYTSLGVISLHLLVLAWAFFFSISGPIAIKPHEKKLVVKTISLQPRVSEPVEEKILPSFIQEIPVQEKPVINEPLAQLPEPAIEAPKVEPESVPISIEPPLEVEKELPKKVEEKKPPTPKPVPKKEVKKDKPKPKKEVKSEKPAVKKPKETSKPVKKEQKKAEDPALKAKKQAESEAATKAKQQQAKDEAAAKAKRAEAEAKRAAAVQARKRELLAKAQESIAKIDQNRGNMSAKSSSATLSAIVPGQIESLQIDSIQSNDGKPMNERELGYRDELASRLKLLLRLPEHGEVKIKLTLERSGKVKQVTIVNSKNQTNQNYIEKILPSLKFPGLGDNFGDVDQYTFLISLSNE